MNRIGTGCSAATICAIAAPMPPRTRCSSAVTIAPVSRAAASTAVPVDWLHAEHVDDAGLDAGFRSSAAASRAAPTMRPHAAMVTSAPSRTTPLSRCRTTARPIPRGSGELAAAGADVDGAVVNRGGLHAAAMEVSSLGTRMENAGRPPTRAKSSMLVRGGTFASGGYARVAAQELHIQPRQWRPAAEAGRRHSGSRKQGRLPTKGMNPWAAKPALTPTRFASAIPMLKNLSGKALAHGGHTRGAGKVAVEGHHARVGCAPVPAGHRRRHRASVSSLPADRPSHRFALRISSRAWRS